LAILQAMPTVANCLDKVWAQCHLEDDPLHNDKWHVDIVKNDFQHNVTCHNDSNNNNSYIIPDIFNKVLNRAFWRQNDCSISLEVLLPFLFLIRFSGSDQPIISCI
jgi:hypothetical protein